MVITMASENHARVRTDIEVGKTASEHLWGAASELQKDAEMVERSNLGSNDEFRGMYAKNLRKISESMVELAFIIETWTVAQEMQLNP